MSQIYLGQFQIDTWLVVLVTVGIVAFIAVTIIWGIGAHRRQIAAGGEELIGKTAEVRVTLDPKGIVFLQGEQWTAISEEGRAEPGEEVIIRRVDSLKLYVTKKNKGGK